MSAESSKSYWAGTAMSVTDVETKFSNKEVVQSAAFSSNEDPLSPSFLLQLSFGVTTGWLGAHIIPIDQDVTFTGLEISLYDDAKVLLQKMDLNSLIKRPLTKKGLIIGRNYFWQKVRLTSAILRCKCEIEYTWPPDSKSGRRGVPALNMDFLKLFESGKNADVTFLVGDAKIEAHKAILSARSTYYSHMFDSGMEENQAKEVEVQDADPKVFRGLLHFLYGGLPPSNLADIATGLYVIADKHGQEELRDLCKANIVTNLNADNVVDALLLAEQYNLSDVLPPAKAFLKLNIRDVEKTEGNFERLKSDPDFLLKLIVRLCDG